MNKSPQYTLQGEPEQCKSEVWEMYLPKGITWTSISEIIVAILENLSEETKSDRAPSCSPNWLQIGLMYGQYPTSNTIQSWHSKNWQSYFVSLSLLLTFDKLEHIGLFVFFVYDFVW